jgi:hypothetical protein
LIRILKVKCSADFNYCKKKFEKEKVYKAYIGKTGYIVLNEGQRVYFNDRRAGHLRSETHTKSFRNHFEIVEENLVKNKLELISFIK